MDALHEKYEALRCSLAALGSVAVAFSAGVDSTFLLKTAADVLGDKAVAVTAQSVFIPAREQDEAILFCREHGIRHFVVTADVLSVEGVAANPPDRCYRCKRALFALFLEKAKALGIPYVAEGSNTDDLGDYRPGMKAIAELGILSPLRDAGLGKQEIRALSREIGLPTWDKPSYACLASRFVYGEPIDPGRLKMVEKAEEKLRSMGLRQLRVRLHGDLARIEIMPDKIPFLAEKREEIAGYLRSLGFRYVTLDLDGFASGSMNRPLG